MSQKEETFQQKRIVQLSRELDSERDKYSKLAKESTFISNKFKEAQEEVEQVKEKLLQYQINNHQLTERIRETQRQCLQLRNNVQREEHLRSEAEVENVRQRQKIDELKGEMLDYENKTKAVLYERTNQLAEKDREIYKLREENIEIEKLYLDQRQKQQRKQEKTLRELTRIFHEFEQFKRQITAFKSQTERSIATERKRVNDLIAQINKRQDQIERRIRIQKQLQAELQQMRIRLQEVVIENSQKIIELYKYKYA